MKKLTKDQQSGFTIIEVVLVLAIAGLIFLVVFLALPQLQKSQRDTQRRSDVGRIIAGVQSYMSNKDGRPPTADLLGSAVIGDGKFVDNMKIDPATGDYKAIVDFSTATTGSAPDLDTIGYGAKGRCDADGFIVNTGSTRQFAVNTLLESGATYCAEG